jgi:hypothetical protein
LAASLFSNSSRQLAGLLRLVGGFRKDMLVQEALLGEDADKPNDFVATLPGSEVLAV